MGDLRHFNLNDIITEYNSKYFVETGTYMGYGVEYAAKYKFKEIYSIELMKDFYDTCCDKFKLDSRIKLYNGTSVEKLSEILQDNNLGATIFWLDAHLPKSHFGSGKQSNYKKDKDILIPLEEEIKIIVNGKDVSKDVFIIEDLRIYEEGNYASGNWLDAMNEGFVGIDFVYKLLGETHDIQKSYDNEGYIYCTPKAI